ncbi:uncharacterized protein LOC125233261 [Leguminivora glycinivorella]|uniref:uncharacterized protein LOC125233261 n=1 Tax=Leguminivora glycinivorella TaxID=1035111 RepID=UPI00200BC514|nr:uncharacterized protein LOC125233261 [Leguminivora glycinivorella]
MSSSKKSGKSKFLAEDLNDFINKSQFVKETPKTGKPQKRNKSAAPALQEDGMSRLMVDQQVSMKKRKISASQTSETPNKVRDTIMQQIESRQQCNDLMLNNLSNIITQLDADHAQMKENQDKLEQLTGALLKCIQQSSAAHKQSLKLLWEFHATFKKRYEEMNALHKEQNEKLTEEIEDDLKNLEQQLIIETKRSGWDNLRKTIFHAMQNDL